MLLNEVKQVQLVPIRDLLENSTLYESTTHYDPKTHTMHIYQIQAELDDGTLLDYQSIKEGKLRHCPTCDAWVSKRNTGVCPETLIAICTCCQISINGRGYSWRGKWKRNLKSFFGGGDVL